MKVRKFIMISMLLCCIGSMGVLAGCETQEEKDLMVKGTLLEAEVDHGKFEFAFTTSDGAVFDNKKRT